jgi:hypothetical protein
MSQLKELLDLFEITELNETSLRIAKKKVLMLHPDKNKVDTTEYYLFFTNAYKKLTQIYNYIHHETDENNFKSHDIDKTFKTYIEKNGYTPTKNPEMYNKCFNEMFNNVHIKDNNDGYEEWLKSEDDIYDKDDIEKSRKKLMTSDLVKVNKIEYCNQSKNNYSDLKDAHVNTIIGLDKDAIYKETPKFNSVIEYEIHRQKSMTKTLSEDESLKMISDQEELEKKQALELSYQLLKKEEEMKKKHKEYVSKYLLIS